MQRPLKTAVFVRSFGYLKLFIMADLADPDCFDPIVPCCFMAIPPVLWQEQLVPFPQEGRRSSVAIREQLQ